MVAHACGRLGGEEIAAGRLEELHGGRAIERRRVGHIDDHLCAGKHFGESFAGDRVDTRVGRGGYRLMTLIAKLLDDLRPDEAGASNNDDLHLRSP